LVAKTTGWTSNKVTINHYTPRGIIVPHRDKDYITGFVPEHEFCIFSLGATRNIVFIRLEDGQPTDDVTAIPLPSGSLLIVSGTLDQTHLHGMYQEPDAQFQPNSNRLSLAFKMHNIKEEDHATTDN
jgi:alkylated DNA repair dioxygenase AlkB